MMVGKKKHQKWVNSTGSDPTTFLSSPPFSTTPYPSDPSFSLQGRARGYLGYDISDPNASKETRQDISLHTFFSLRTTSIVTGMRYTCHASLKLAHSFPVRLYNNTLSFMPCHFGMTQVGNIQVSRAFITSSFSSSVPLLYYLEGLE